MCHSCAVQTEGAYPFKLKFCCSCAQGKITKNTKSMEIVKRMYVEPGVVAKSLPGSPLLTKVLPMLQITYEVL